MCCARSTTAKLAWLQKHSAHLLAGRQLPAVCARIRHSSPWHSSISDHDTSSAPASACKSANGHLEQTTCRAAALFRVIDSGCSRSEEAVAQVVVVKAVQPDVAVLAAGHKALAVRVVSHRIDRPKVPAHLTSTSQSVIRRARSSSSQATRFTRWTAQSRCMAGI